MTRRLVGWRVRWEYRTGRVWGRDQTGLLSLTSARESMRLLRDDDRCRNVRVMRVWGVKR